VAHCACGIGGFDQASFLGGDFFDEVQADFHGAVPFSIG
jgi:hypothetical protein